MARCRTGAGARAGGGAICARPRSSLKMQLPLGLPTLLAFLLLKLLIAHSLQLSKYVPLSIEAITLLGKLHAPI